MTSTTTKLLFLTFAVMYMMVMATAQRTPKPLAAKPETLSPSFSFKPCPFDCNKVCVVKVGSFYKCSLPISKCCKNACVFYHKCLLTKLEWACYADTLDYVCKCRKLSTISTKE
ncbi:Hypothetical predicted protein [Paramuricea clavata]|uniref:Uncharacterized protein n=1 Tax=Paramuricea clavata TaxID=317549 RepID=A0A6S7IHL0_PARCT|nr:Hypothetical predicted protein [Paramuricea clavata]